MPLEGDTLRTAIRLIPLTILAATVLAGPAFAQGVVQGAAPAPAVKTKPPVAAQPKVLVSNSSNPTFDEGTIQRIAAAMLSYTVLEVQGGWPMIPSAAKLAPGAKGP